MNLRTLLIIAGLALPIVTFAILSQSVPQSSSEPPKNTDTVAKAEKPKPAAIATNNTNTSQAAVAPDGGQIPPGVKVGPASPPPVILPPISKNGTQAAAPVSANGAVVAEKAPLPPGTPTLQQLIEKTKARLGELEKLTAADWPAERQRHPNAPATLAEAKDFNRNRLAKLATMTEEQYQKEVQANVDRASQRWQKMSPQQQMEALKNAQNKEKPALPKLTPAGASNQ